MWSSRLMPMFPQNIDIYYESSQHYKPEEQHWQAWYAPVYLWAWTHMCTCIYSNFRLWDVCNTCNYCYRSYKCNSMAIFTDHSFISDRQPMGRMLSTICRGWEAAGWGSSVPRTGPETSHSHWLQSWCTSHLLLSPCKNALFLSISTMLTFAFLILSWNCYCNALWHGFSIATRVCDNVEH